MGVIGTPPLSPIFFCWGARVRTTPKVTLMFVCLIRLLRFSCLILSQRHAADRQRTPSNCSKYRRQSWGLGYRDPSDFEIGWWAGPIRGGSEGYIAPGQGPGQDKEIETRKLLLLLLLLEFV